MAVCLVAETNLATGLARQQELLVLTSSQSAERTQKQSMKTAETRKENARISFTYAGRNFESEILVPKSFPYSTPTDSFGIG
jgi:ubiquitin-protein ligase